MKYYYLLLLSLLFVVGIACKDNHQDSFHEESVNQIQKKEIGTLSKADSIINDAILAHGGEKYNVADYSFVFRNKKFRFQNNNNSYTYIAEFQKGDTLVKDVLKDGKFERYMNANLQNIKATEIIKYSEALNSVIYFATLPYKLNDASVRKKYIEKVQIKNDSYDVIEVTFDIEGGGKDFEDEFYYWINKNTHKMDYLAYRYHTNDGGIRFREAYNRRVVDGITFQDYINYEAPFEAPLIELPQWLQSGRLKEVSRIETEHIINNNQ